MRKPNLYALLICASLPVSTVLADTSEVAWNFDGGTIGEAVTSVTDLTGNITATPDGSGTVTFAEERAGGSGDSSVELAGNGFLRVADDLALTGHADGGRGFETLEIRAWVYPTITHAGAAQLVRKYDTPGAGTVGYELFLVGDNQVGFSVHGIGGSSSVFSEEGVVAPADQWTEVVGSWDGVNGTISLTVNSDVAMEVSETTILPRTGNYLGLGALIRPSDTYGQFFTGRLDDVSISGQMAPPLVEVARWDMEGTAGQDIGEIDGALDDYPGFLALADIQGTGPFIRFNSEARPGSSGSTSAEFSNAGAGDDDGALLVVGDHPSITGHLNDGPGYEAFEVEMWVKPMELGRNMQLFRKTDDGEVGMWLAIQSDGTVRARLEAADGKAVSQTTEDALVVDEWYHIRFGFDLNVLYQGGFPNFYLHVDDIVRATPNAVVDLPLANTTTHLGLGGLVRPGNTSKGQYFHGLMDDVVFRAAVVDSSSLGDGPTSARDWLLY